MITQVPNLLLMKRPAIADPKAKAKPKAGAQKKPAAAPKAPTPEESDNSKLFIIIFIFWLPLARLLIEEAPGITNHICRILLLRRVLQMSSYPFRARTMRKYQMKKKKKMMMMKKKSAMQMRASR